MYTNRFAQMLPNFVATPSFDESILLSKDNAFPKISVVTPSFNQAAYLERTILSVLNQNYPNLEYIILDGGSTDGSVEIIKKYEKYLAYWVSEKDKGQTDAINRGLKMATGHWLTFQNSDDVFAPDAFNNLLKGIKSNPSTSIFFGNFVFIDEHDRTYEIMKSVPFSIYAQVYEGIQVHNQSFFFKKQVCEQFGYFDAQYTFAFDYEIMARWGIQSSVKTKLINDLWGGFRVHSSAKSSTISETGLREHAHIKAHYHQQLKPVLPEKIIYLYIRIRKILYFLLTDFGYLQYRNQLKQQHNA